MLEGECNSPTGCVAAGSTQKLVRVSCSNAFCTQSPWLHEKCFEKWSTGAFREARLKKGFILDNKASEEKQIKWLWGKGYDVVMRLCVCRCNKGNLKPAEDDEPANYEPRAPASGNQAGDKPKASAKSNSKTNSGSGPPSQPQQRATKKSVYSIPPRSVLVGPAGDSYEVRMAKIDGSVLRSTNAAGGSGQHQRLPVGMAAPVVSQATGRSRRSRSQNAVARFATATTENNKQLPVRSMVSDDELSQPEEDGEGNDNELRRQTTTNGSNPAEDSMEDDDDDGEWQTVGVKPKKQTKDHSAFSNYSKPWLKRPSTARSNAKPRSLLEGITATDCTTSDGNAGAGGYVPMAPVFKRPPSQQSQYQYYSENNRPPHNLPPRMQRRSVEHPTATSHRPSPPIAPAYTTDRDLVGELRAAEAPTAPRQSTMTPDSVSDISQASAPALFNRFPAAPPMRLFDHMQRATNAAMDGNHYRVDHTPSPPGLSDELSNDLLNDSDLLEVMRDLNIMTPSTRQHSLLQTHQTSSPPPGLTRGGGGFAPVIERQQSPPLAVAESTPPKSPLFPCVPQMPQLNPNAREFRPRHISPRQPPQPSPNTPPLTPPDSGRSLPPTALSTTPWARIGTIEDANLYETDALILERYINILKTVID